MSGVKKQQAELKAIVQQTFNEIKNSLKPRTAFDYQQDIYNSYKLNSLKKLLNTFEKLKGLPKEGKLTKQAVNKVYSLQDRQIMLSSKLSPKTREQSKGTRRKKERKALGEKFKEIYIYLILTQDIKKKITFILNSYQIYYNLSSNMIILN